MVNCPIFYHIKYFPDTHLVSSTIVWIMNRVLLSLFLRVIEAEVAIEPNLSFSHFIETDHILIGFDRSKKCGKSIKTSKSWFQNQ